MTFNISIDAATTSQQTAAIQGFSHYKLNAIKYEFLPTSNVVGTTGKASTVTTVSAYAPTVLSLFINNRDEVYSNFLSVSQNPRHRSHLPMARITRFTKLKPQIDVTMGATNVTYSAPNRFISSTDTDAVYGRFLVIPQEGGAIGAESETTQVYNLKITSYVTMNNLNVNTGA